MSFLSSLHGWIERRKPFMKGMCRLWQHGVRVLRSGMFDGKWYLRQHPNLAGTKWPALCHYVWRGCVDDPSLDFCSQEYLYMNPDVARCRIPAILHYERYGRHEGRSTSLLGAGREPTFPIQAEAFTTIFDSEPHRYGRIAVFASYSGNGRI